MTDQENEQIGARLAEIDADPSRAAEGAGLRQEIDSRIRAAFERRELDLKDEHKIAKALGYKSTQRYLASLMKEGRPNAKWQRFDSAKLRDLREGLAPSKRSQTSFAKKCGVSVDTVQHWEKTGRARAVDFEVFVGYLSSECPNVDVRSVLLKTSR